jgi:hypothetical protein
MAKKRWGVVANESLAFLRHLAFLRQENAAARGESTARVALAVLSLKSAPCLPAIAVR